MTAPSKPTAEDTKRQSVAYFKYLSQGDIWQPRDGRTVRIADMDQAWRHNAARWLERRAARMELLYGMGEIYAFAEPAVREVVGELDGQPVFKGPMLSHFDLMSECAQDAFDQESMQREDDPVAWIRTTPLYRALVAGLPSDGPAFDEVVTRARHYSTCPQRDSAEGECICHLSECAIRNGHPEMGCTCRSTSPEWTLS